MYYHVYMIASMNHNSLSSKQQIGLDVWKIKSTHTCVQCTCIVYDLCTYNVRAYAYDCFE